MNRGGEHVVGLLRLQQSPLLIAARGIMTRGPTRAIAERTYCGCETWRLTNDGKVLRQTCGLLRQFPFSRHILPAAFDAWDRRSTIAGAVALEAMADDELGRSRFTSPMIA